MLTLTNREWLEIVLNGAEYLGTQSGYLCRDLITGLLSLTQQIHSRGELDQRLGEPSTVICLCEHGRRVFLANLSETAPTTQTESEKILQLQRALLDASRFIPGDQTIVINASTNRLILEAWQVFKRGEINSPLLKPERLLKTKPVHLLECDEAHAHRVPQCCGATCWCRSHSQSPESDVPEGI